MIYLFTISNASHSTDAGLWHGDYYYDTIASNIYIVDVFGNYYQHGVRYGITCIDGIEYGKQNNVIYQDDFKSKDEADRYIENIILSKILENI